MVQFAFSPHSTNHFPFISRQRLLCALSTLTTTTMIAYPASSAAFMLSCLLLSAAAFAVNVTYDHRAILIDGKRRLLVSGSIHYPRSTPEMWPDLIQKSKDGGIDVIETYVFWNLHEPKRNQYDFEGRKDLVQFLKLIARAGLYAHLRIGPYVCAEWNYGGFPLWLHFIPGIQLRTDNEPYKKEMQRFTTYIVNLMKQEKLYASQDGPIILSQIENEYGNVQSGYGSGAAPYIKWAAGMALSQNTGVPWVMCQQKDAPDPIIDTCNGFYCDQYASNSPKKPKVWTENWTGWFLAFGGAVPYRPVEDLAFAVARFYQLGGTFQNYYMYHGGTNFGRTTGGPFISTSYDYDAPIDEYGQLQQPKWGHLKELHKALKLCEDALVASEPETSSLGPNLSGTVYKSGTGACLAAFLSNVDRTSAANATFNGITYKLPAWSVSILPDCKNVVLNTAQINAISAVPSYAKVNSLLKAEWSWINEPVGVSKKTAFEQKGLLEQINVTADTSDYLWYSISTNTEAGSEAVLSVESLGHALHVFSNGKKAGSATGSSGSPKVSKEFPITLTTGRNTIDLLSLTVGLQNYGAHFDLTGAGVTGPVKLRSKNGSSVDLSSDKWTYQVGLQGEDSGLPQGSSNGWTSDSALRAGQPLVWFKTSFDAPSGNNPVAIDFTGMGKGEAWVNGQSIGRYWPTYKAPSSGCTDSCDYRGPYSSSKCLKNCGKPSQHLYHVPRSWLKSSGNILVLFEEIGGDPTQISFVTRQLATACATVSESHPVPVDLWKVNSNKRQVSKPTLSLHCPDPNQVISTITFASFGNPKGTCGSFGHGKCSSADAISIVQKACVGKKNCTIEVSRSTFGSSCPSLINSLAVEASCTYMN